MYAHLKGTITETAIEKDALRAVIDVAGIGYDVFLPKSAEGFVLEGKTMTLYVNESVTAFDGATTLYGFVSRDQKDLFLRLRHHVDGMGPKKALETMDKVNKSLPDFKRAIVDEDDRLLVSVFGFTKKTAEKLIHSLKGQADSWKIAGTAKWADTVQTPQESDALYGLLHLGYCEDEARELLNKARAALGETTDAGALLTEAVRLKGART